MFGALKSTLGGITARVSEWMGIDYVKDALIAAGLTFLEEANNTFVRSALRLTGTPNLVADAVHKIGFSALYYALFNKLGRPDLALVTSVIPVTLLGVDIIKAIVKRGPEDLGRELAMRLGAWRGVARTSASTTTTTTTVVKASPSRKTVAVKV